MTFIRKIFAIIGVLMGFMAMGLSFSLINANLESLQISLGASMVQLQWIINIYGIFIASNLVTMGRLGDIYGRKKIFLIGMVLFAIAMLGGGLATSPTVIIAFQALWGLSGAILLPISQAILVDLFPDEKKSIAMGIWNCVGGISLAIGPLIGGIILNFFNWQWIFLINIPFIVLSFILTSLFARESKTEGESKKIDWAGALTLKIAIILFVLATVQRNIWQTPIILCLYGVSLIAFLLLIAIEKRVEMPIVRSDLFKNQSFLFYCLGGFCMIGVFWSALFLLPFYIQKQLHYTPLQTGFMLLGFALPIAFLSPLSGYLYNKIAPKNLIRLGFFLLIFSCIMQLQFQNVTSPLFIALAILFLGIGFGLISTPTLTGAISVISRNYAGVASGAFVTMQEIGGSIGLALTVAVARRYVHLEEGFHHAMWIIFSLALLGMSSTFFLQKKAVSTQEETEL